MSKKKPTQDLVSVGPKHVQKKYHGKRDENGLKPSTSRALILRNGKDGARGTGELMLAGRMTGREKLDLLAGTFISVLFSILLNILQRTSYYRDHVLLLWLLSSWTSALRSQIRSTMV